MIAPTANPFQTLRHAVPLTEADLPAVRLRRQWAVIRDCDPRPTHWRRFDAGIGLSFFAHPEARVRRVNGASGHYLVVGVVVDTHNPIGDLSTRLRATDSDDLRGIVNILRDWTGTYTLLACSASHLWIYTDAASLETVYYGNGRAASSPILLPNLVRDCALDNQFRLDRVDDWYPGSLCPYRNVRALLANHRLEVCTGKIERFWPDCTPAPVSRRDAIDQIGSLLRAGVIGLHRQAPVLASLTGGKDTRLCLAASRDIVDDVEFFTVNAAGVRACDLSIAEAIAQKFKLNHRFVENEAAPEWLLAAYDEMTDGMSLGARRDIVGACRALASEGYVHLNGNLGAMAKRFYWPTKCPSGVSIGSMVGSFASRARCIASGLGEWLATVPNLPPATVYNLMYLEQRGGRWEAVGESASKLFYNSMTPFCNRRVFELVCGVPPLEQGHGLLVDVVRRLWPELLSVPYCPPSKRWTRAIPKGLRARVRRLLPR